ncbi:MAG: PDGLE domain-containing protein [Actinobacteria bacterium]|nr:PDGLE domain-containing protein [Actinomycetota bacterium]
MKTKRNILFAAMGILIIFIIAMALSLVASSFPDGLEKVAERYGFIDRAVEILPERFFLIPDYSFGGVENKYWQTSLAGLFGVLIILAFFTVVYLVYRIASNKIPGKDQNR